MRFAPLLLAAFLLTATVHAQAPACELGTAENALATPSLYANLFNTGALFFGGSTTNGDGYLVPRVRAKSPLFAAGLWLGGTVGGEVRVAAAHYTNFNFWPGPLNPGATLPNPADCSGYDRIYVVSPADVADYQAGRPASPDLRDWPVGLGARTIDAAGQPVVPTSRQQVVNLAAGERPVVYGGPTAFWVMNDAGQPVHPGTLSSPLGVEVRVTAFSPYGLEALRQSTVYQYEIVNRGTAPIENFRAALYMDPDLGNASDDIVGTDTTRQMVYVYNADDIDEGATGYGIPPAFGAVVLDPTGGDATPFERLGSASYFIGGGPPTTTGDPILAGTIYNYLQGLWGDGTPMRALGTGYNQPTSAPVTRFMFDGDPVTGQPWSEVNNGTAFPMNSPGDRREVATSDAITLAPGASVRWSVALVFAQGADRFDSVVQLRQPAATVRQLAASGALFSPSYTTLPPIPPPAATTLLTPPDNADFNTTRPSSITFAWTPVADADLYRFEIGTTPDFSDSLSYAFDVLTTDATLSYQRFPAHDGMWTYWRVIPVNFGGDAPTAEVRRFAYTTYRLVFTSFEVVANSAGPLVPPQPGAYADAGFPTPGGANPGPLQQASTPNEWSFFTGGQYRTYEDWLDRVTNSGSNNGSIFSFDFEMRFTGTSLAAVTGVFGQTAPDFVVPFELWNIGSGTPGDPSDDVRMIPLVLDGQGGVPDSVYGPIRDSAGVLLDSPLSLGTDDPYTDWLYWYNPTDTSPGTAGYDAYVASRTADPTDTSQIGEEVFARTVLVSVNGASQIRRFPLPEAGTVFRIWTSGPAFVDDEPGAEAAALTLGVHPNPVRGTAQVPFSLAAASDVRLSVVDVLGRTVAVLAEGPHVSGPHAAALDASRLAAGVYVVVLAAGDERTVRRLTVVR